MLTLFQSVNVNFEVFTAYQKLLIGNGRILENVLVIPIYFFKFEYLNLNKQIFIDFQLF